MIHGIGIDHCSISRIQRILDRGGVDAAFFRKTFTEAERAEGAKRHDTAAFYAARFAVKEAVFKAITAPGPEQSERDTSTADILSSGPDLRQIESLHMETGRPYVSMNEAIRPWLEAYGITALHLSVTTEEDTAAAFVIAESSSERN
ncbi:MAG: holo-ACP synthase [Oscillospiraceae bacterium]|nr:holo-ACP synthase [Oscillospiraceae bacterium]